MAPIAETLARWAHDHTPSTGDRTLADRALLDTMAVTLAARDDELAVLAASLPDAARWAAVGHVLDYDDVHLPSTTHVSVMIVPAVLATGGDARAYLAGAGVMVRLGVALGWPHYLRGWHATCTAGAPGAAVAAAISLGLSPEQTVRAIALAVPAAGGVQRAFGTSAKSLQVGFAAEAGVRAARLAAAGATADPAALDQWLELVGGDPARLDPSGPAVPGGLAIKMFPCCYALQRPISALREQLPLGVCAADVAAIRVRTPESTVRPLIHHRPQTGLQGKFSLEYAIAAAMLDPVLGFDSFTDAAVTRPEAQRLVDLVRVTLTPSGDGLMAGTVEITLLLRDGNSHSVSLRQPPGAPERPPLPKNMRDKLAACGPDVPELLAAADWATAPAILARHLPSAGQMDARAT